MGRGFKVARPNFVEDFIYQPPWELLTSALSKKEQDIQDTADRAELLRNVEIQFRDGDKDNVFNIQKDIENKIDTLTTNLQKNALDPNNRAELLRVQRELSERFKRGDIYNIHKTKENMDKFEAQIAALPDANDRDAYRKKYIEGFWEENESGSIAKPFDYSGELYSNRDFVEELTSSNTWKALTPEEKQDSWANLVDDGKYMSTGTRLKANLLKDKIKKVAKNFLEGQNIEGYAQDREKVRDQKWFDSNGELDFESKDAEPYKMMSAAMELERKKDISTQSKSADSYGFAKSQRDEALGATSSAGGINSPSKNIASFYATPIGKKVVEEHAKRVTAIAVAALEARNMDTDSVAVNAYLETLMGEPRQESTKHIYDAITSLNARFNQEKRTGLKQLEGYGVREDELKKFEAFLAKPDAEEYLLTQKGQIVFDHDDPGMIPREVSAKDLLNQDAEKFGGPAYKGYLITGYEPVKGSVEMVLGANLDAANNPQTGGLVNVKFTVSKPATVGAPGSSQNASVPPPISALMLVGNNPFNL